MYTTIPMISQRRRCKLTVQDGARFFPFPPRRLLQTVLMIFVCFLVFFGVGVVFFLCCFLDLSLVFEAFVTCLSLFSEVLGRSPVVLGPGGFCVSGPLWSSAVFGPTSVYFGLCWAVSLVSPKLVGVAATLGPDGLFLGAGLSLSFSAADEKALPHSEPCDG